MQLAELHRSSTYLLVFNPADVSKEEVFNLTKRLKEYCGVTVFAIASKNATLGFSEIKDVTLQELKDLYVEAKGDKS